MSDAYIGEIRMFGGTYAPVGWALCDGQLLPIAQYETLYALIGTTYGGDGQTAFAVPDLRGRLPVHAGTNPKTGTAYTRGQAGGAETATLALQHLPAHSHDARCQTNSGGSATPTNAYWAKPTNGSQYQAATAASAMMSPGTTLAGGGQAHDNVMPYLPLNFIIATEGFWPSPS